MKKAALTFGLFSLVMVATSFANPEKTSRSYSDNTIDIGIGTDGGQIGKDGRHKTDFVGTGSQSNINYNNSNGFDSDRQSLRIDVKLD